MKTLTITKPDDWHLHLRDGEFLNLLLPTIVKQFQRAIVMPNLKTPITSIDQAVFYRKQIIATLPDNTEFDPLMTLYLTTALTKKDIREVNNNPYIYALKLYPKGATTNSEFGIDDFNKLDPILDEMSQLKIPLLVHGEKEDLGIDIFDREKFFIDDVLIPMQKRHPELKIVLEHISTKDAVDFVIENNICATITAHHLQINRNDLLSSKLYPHHFCAPIVKSYFHQEALIKAATSGNPKFFLGTDSAPHPKENKESGIVNPGICTSYCALALYLEVFDRENKLDNFEQFASISGPKFYNLPINSKKITLIKNTQIIPKELTSDSLTVIPFKADKSVNWSIKS